MTAEPIRVEHREPEYRDPLTDDLLMPEGPGFWAVTRFDESRWLAPVRPGDRLSGRVTVLSANPSRSKPDRGIVITLIEMRNQAGDTVLSLKPVNLLRRRPAA